MKLALSSMLAGVAALAAGTEAKLKLPNSRTDLLRGEKLFQVHCALCHGPKGEGGRGPSREKQTRLRDELIQKYANDPNGLQKAMREARAANGDGGQRAKLAGVVKHINHVVEIAGVDAVGLGSDFDGIRCAPEGLDSVDKWPNLTRALLEEGYTAAEIRKIYGENTLRLMSAVERAAAHGGGVK